MEADSNTHPDEGTIHAWLDDALDAATADRIAAHVRECADCAERVAEARGLIAGSSRIIAALDEVPAGTRPAWAHEPIQRGEPARPVAPPAVEVAPTGDTSLWRMLRVTPARAAIAATLIVAVGITLTRPSTVVDAPRSSTSTPETIAPSSGVASAPEAARGAGASADAGTSGGGEAAQRDGLLDSAIARRLAIAQPPRAVSAAPGPAIPQAPVNAASASVAPDTLAGLRVAEGRRAVQAQRAAGMDERGDKVQTRAAAIAAAPAAEEAVMAAKAADSTVANRRADISAADMAVSGAVAGAGSCYRIESSERGATWGGEPLPLIVPAESSAERGGSVTVRSASGAPTTIRARWVRSARDSVRLALSRTGYTGAMELGPELAGGRSGIARSGPASANLESVVVVGYGDQPGAGASSESQSRGRAGSATGRREAARSTESTAPSRNPTAQAAPPAAAAVQAPAPEPAPMRALPVTMRAVSCPSR